MFARSSVALVLIVATACSRRSRADDPSEGPFKTDISLTADTGDVYDEQPDRPETEEPSDPIDVYDVFGSLNRDYVFDGQGNCAVEYSLELIPGFAPEGCPNCDVTFTIDALELRDSCAIAEDLLGMHIGIRLSDNTLLIHDGVWTTYASGPSGRTGTHFTFSGNTGWMDIAYGQARDTFTIDVN